MMLVVAPWQLRLAVSVAGILWSLGCALLMPGDYAILVQGQVDTNERDCQLKIIDSRGQRVLEGRIDPTFSRGFAARSRTGYRAQIACRSGQLVSRQYELNTRRDARTVDLGAVRLDGPKK